MHQDCGIQTENMEPPPDGSDISRPQLQTASSEESRQDDVLELPAIEDDIFVDASSSPLAEIRMYNRMTKKIFFSKNLNIF